jgi:hypothetical protein
MSSATQQVNLIVPKGSDRTVLFNLYDWPDQFELVANAAYGDTGIRVKRVNTEIPSGTVIDIIQDDEQAYRTATVGTTTTGTDSGQTYKTINVAALDRNLVKGWNVRIPQDISSRTFEGQVRKSQYDASTALWGPGEVIFSFSDLRPAINATATQGQITLTFNATDTASLLVSPELVGVDIGKWCDSQLAKQPYIVANNDAGTEIYTYSVEETTGGDRVQKFYGRVMVTGDSTYA